MFLTLKKSAALIILFPLCLFAQNIFWIDGVSHLIQTRAFDNPATVKIDTSTGTAFGIAADTFNKKLFWVDNSSRSIKCSNLDGTNAQVILDSAEGLIIPRGIALNAQDKIIYWTDNGRRTLMSANYLGNNITVLDSGLDCPGYAAYDSVGKKIYWADNGLNTKKILRCNPDGTNKEVVVTGLTQVWGIAVDDITQEIYWIDSGIEKIQMGSLNSSLPVSKNDIITNLTDSQRGLVLDQKSNKMYWSSTQGKIMEANLDGTGEVVADSGLYYPQGITLVDSLLTISGIKYTPSLPLHFALMQNYPNPFNPSTTIRFDISHSSFVTLKVYDVIGREVAALLNKNEKPGSYQINWNADGFASGVYFYRIQAGDSKGSAKFIETKKLILLK